MVNLGRLTVSIQVLAAAFTVLVGIKMAQPWGDNYAYQDIGGYIGLGVFMSFAVSPYVGLALLPRGFRNDRKALTTFLVGASIVSLVAAYVYFQAAFVVRDAQSGLAFFSVPIGQWFAAAILWLICDFLRRFDHSNA